MQSPPRPERRSAPRLNDALLPGPYRRVAMVAEGVPPAPVLELTDALTERDGAEVVLYDLAATAGFTSPFPPGEGGTLPPLLNEADLQRVGRADLIAPLQRLSRQTRTRVYLAPEQDLADLLPLVQREQIDLVICALPAGDRRLARAHEARRAAALLHYPPDGEPRHHPRLAPGEMLPPAERVRLPLLIGILAAFFFARQRSRV